MTNRAAVLKTYAWFIGWVFPPIAILALLVIYILPKLRSFFDDSSIDLGSESFQNTLSFFQGFFLNYFSFIILGIAVLAVLPEAIPNLRDRIRKPYLAIMAQSINIFALLLLFFVMVISLMVVESALSSS